MVYMYVACADGYVCQSFQLIKATFVCGKSVSLQGAGEVTERQ